MNDTPESNKDYTIERMLSDAQSYVADQEAAHPTGLKGAFIIFSYSEEREELPYESDDPKDNAFTYMCSGLAIDQMIVSMAKVKFRLLKQQITGEIKKELRELGY